jgi:hypothetical protein
MSQTIERVGCSVKGSSIAVVESGITSMSLASMACQPRIEEPSKPKPSSKEETSSSWSGTEKCCHVPGQSVNLRSTITMLFLPANSRTSVAFFMPD